MKLSIMQPYFLPYLGYWQLIECADKFILYDDVNFIKGGWINRNRYLYQGQAKMFNLIMQGASPYKKINEIELQMPNSSYNPHEKLLSTIKMAYKKAPMYQEVIPLIENILLFNEENLAKYIENSIRKMCEYLNIDTEILVSSNIEKTPDLTKEKRVIDICKRLGATYYINAIGGKTLYDVSNFRKNGIELRFIKMGEIKYEQFDNHFVEGLSILDVLMFNDLETIKLFLKNYTLEG